MLPCLPSSTNQSNKLPKVSPKNNPLLLWEKSSMFKTILRNSVNILFQNPKIIRLSFLTLVFFSIVRMYFLIYYFNTFLIYKYESGIQLSDAFIYILDKLNNQGLMMTIIFIGIVYGFILSEMLLLSLLSKIQNNPHSNPSSKDLGNFSPCSNIADFQPLLECLLS